MNNEYRDVRFDYFQPTTRSDGLNLWCTKPTESAEWCVLKNNIVRY